MTVGIIGLGLIGGSFAKAFKAYTAHRVLGYDREPSITQYAKLTDTIDDEVTDDVIGTCDLLLLAAYPTATVEYLTQKAPLINRQTVVVDLGGVKRCICEKCQALAHQWGFTFVGGHPMAGLHRSGLKYATADLYQGASMILTPENTDDIRLLERVTKWFKSVGFASVTVTTPSHHDEIIAFTSQLAHVVSNAYVKSPRAQIHRGFSAGSYQDLTRVARLNETMWTELFLENRDNLMVEIRHLIQSLEAYEAALSNNDAETLKALLREGRERKERIDVPNETC